MKEIIILGISAFYHDSAAALLVDGELVAAAQEERFSRIKHDSSFPIKAVEYCLNQGEFSLSYVDYVIFYDDSKLKFKRLLSNFLSYAPKGPAMFCSVMDGWLHGKRMVNAYVMERLSTEFNIPRKLMPKYYFTRHHRSHAASAFFPSPFEEALVVCVDGVGEWETTSIWFGSDNSLTQIKSIHFPHSLGLLYSAFTYYLGFKVNSGEYKVMGLAPYGRPIYTRDILDNLVKLNEDGSFELNMKYFSFPYNKTMINKKFCDLFGMPARSPDSLPVQKHLDIAISIQKVIEDILIKIASHAFEAVQCENLCLAGGVALNCVANSNILEKTRFKNVWVQPAAGDAGGSAGAALSFWHEFLNKPRRPAINDKMKNAYLGPAFSDEHIVSVLECYPAVYQKLDQDILLEKIAQLISDGKVIGWFRGRMEFGPRALGNRSIFADPRSSVMQSILNQKIKKRESFRPFAPVVKFDKAGEYFESVGESPYMLFVYDVRASKRIKVSTEMDGFEKLSQKRSTIPAVTHVDYSARVQTITRQANPVLYNLIDKFEELTGCAVLINTSFNERGEPIVCSPEDAYDCFMRTDMDALVVENYLMLKGEQVVDRKLFHKRFEKD